MKVALLNDTHFGCRNDSLILSRYFERFFREIFFPDIQRRGVIKIVHLGDLFDRRKFINFTTLDQSRRFFFDQCRERGLEMDILAGNHDCAYRNTNSLNSLDLLLTQYKNINVYIDPTEKVLGRSKVLYLPWICSENEAESIRLINTTDARYLFGHLHLKGFEIVHGHVSEEGWEAPMFGKFDMVCSGHFHKKSSAGNIFYLGTQYEMTWADFDQYKGFHYLDLDTGQLEYVINPLKLFSKIIYDDTKEVPDPEEDKIRDRYIRVIVRSKKDPYLFDKYVANLNEMQPANLFIMEERQISTSGEEVANLQVEDTLSILKKYIEAIPENHVPKNNVIGLMTQLYMEASEFEG